MVNNLKNASYTGTATGAASRTLGARSHDVFYLRDFFQTTDIGWNAAFTRVFAASASTNGGMIILPPGTLAITGPIILPDDQAGRRIIGCGATDAQNNGTCISGNFRDYLLVIPQNTSGTAPVSSIEGIFFAQGFLGTKGDITQVDSPSGTVSPGTGYGGLYLGLSFSRVEGCTIQLSGGGVGIYYQGIENSITNFQIKGQTSGALSAPECIGIWLENGRIQSGKVMTCRMGIAAITNSGISVENINIERNQYGVWLGANPLAYYDRNASVPPPIVVNPALTITPTRALIKNVTFDSHGSLVEGGAYFYVASTANVIENFSCESFGQDGMVPDHGIYLNGGANTIRNGRFSGIYNIAAVELVGSSDAGGNIFYGVSATASAAVPTAVGWKLPSAGNSMLTQFTNCNVNGARPLSTIIGGHGNIETLQVEISDSIDPAWTLPSGPSNVGKPITGGGTHRVFGRWNGSAWAIAGGDTGVRDGNPVTLFLDRTAGLDGTHITAYTNLINSLITAGLISGTNGTSAYFDALFICATSTQGNGIISLLNGPPNATVVGAVTFTPDRGFSVSDGTNGNGLWSNAPTTGGNFLNNSAHISVWVANTPTSVNAACGYKNTASADWEVAQIYPRSSTDGKAYYWINDRSGTFSAGVTTASAQGHYLANRTGVDTQQGYKNGSDQGVVSIVNSSGGTRVLPPTGATGMAFGATANVTTLPGTLNAGYPGQIAAFSFGGSLNSTQVTAFYNALRTYMTAMGVP